MTDTVTLYRPTSPAVLQRELLQRGLAVASLPAR
jgi:hypothetical protein